MNGSTGTRSTMSVVIPALNEGASIGTCLASLADQDYAGEVEVIVVDNGSEDDTAAIATAAGALVVYEPTRGVCHARQAGTAVATGEIVVSTDADTTFPSGWLTQIDDAMSDRPEVVATCGPCHFVDGPWWSSPYTRLVFGTVAFLYRRTGRVLYASATNIAFRRAAWSGYDTRLTQGGDELGLLRNLRKRGHVHFDSSRVTETSSRRLHKGLLYSVFVTCLFFYLGAYLINRMTGRTTLGSAPAIRTDLARPTGAHRRRTVCATATVALLALAWWLTPIDVI